MVKKFEVAIVGGGPAGATCGYELAKAGVDVAIFDHSHPREKPCGGAISNRIFNELKIPRNVYEKKINWLILESPRGDRVEIPCKNAGVVVMRKKIDYWLFQRALNKGIEHKNEQVIDVIQKKDRWIVKTNVKKYEANFLVGADGCPSLVRNKVLGPIPKQHLAYCIVYHAPHESEYIENNFLDALELYFLGKQHVKSGYVWVFPKLEHITVGIGSRLGVFELKKSLDEFINSHPVAKKIINKGNLIPHAHLFPFINSPSFYDLPTTGKNWMLIGDAACHVNSITGEGIYYAVTGGKLASKSYLENNIYLFEKYWREKYGSDMYWGAKMQKLFYNDLILNTAIKIGQKSKTMQRFLADIITSNVSYDTLFKKRIFFDSLKSLVELLYR